MLDWGIDPLAPEKLPEVLGRYQVLLPIASGGVATVYLGSSVGAAGFEREVAIKLTHRHLRDSPEFFTQLLDEARLAGKIRHPNVVSVHDVGLSDKSAFIVMDYVEGESLSAIQQILKHRHARMPLPIALKILEDVLAGLHAAHELTDDDGSPLYVVHRDVTPHNILVGVDGVSRLTDFGVAKARARLTMTSPGLVKGKIAYMAPEQAQGHGIDRRVDVWAAGVIAWETFTGTRLYEGQSDAATLLKIVRESPLGLRAIKPEVPAAIEAAVARALSLDMSARYPTAEAFAEALAAAARSAGLARAERKDVTQFLEPLLGDRLARRREKAREVRSLRQRMGELTALDQTLRPSHTDLGRAAAPSQPRLEALATATVQESPATATVTELDGSVGEGHTQTGTAGISTMARSIMPPRRGRLLAIAGVAGAGLLVVGLLALFSGGGDEAPAPAAAPPRPSSTTATPPAPAPKGDEPAPSASPLDPSPVTSAPKAKPKGPALIHKAAGRGAAPSTGQKPLENPYKKP